MRLFSSLDGSVITHCPHVNYYAQLCHTLFIPLNTKPQYFSTFFFPQIYKQLIISTELILSERSPKEFKNW